MISFNVLPFMVGIHVMLTYPAHTLECKTFCYSGEYCTVTHCHRCTDGYYMDTRVHRNTFCKPWTQKEGPCWKKVEEGTTETDIKWSCNGSYHNESFIMDNNNLEASFTIVFVIFNGVLCTSIILIQAVMLRIWTMIKPNPNCTCNDPYMYIKFTEEFFLRNGFHPIHH
ncbi:hypothetical protein Bpfe_011144 [Biomphalaria pfeifferi]|uniref:G-protein coupled receptors family 2 profile 1 domain-containing protein n=1 Tax=Biomphalaria pfeifferi TaxID=112525 RepID=A0AAD8FCI9_BIOPF|nr:hypothetical protein Bpfe_011144 [Biomphalaria pfeifferi]